MIGRVRLPSQHKGQQLVRSEQRRYNWLCAGRRWRKSSLLTALAIEAGLAGKQVLCGSPTFDQTRILWNYSRKALGEVGSINKTRLEIELPNQGKIIYRSLDDPTHIRGHSADLVLIDECPLVKPEVWHEALLPMLVDSGGSAWLSGTPNGRNWFFVEHQLEGEDRMSWSIPTVGCAIVDNNLSEVPNRYSNPHIPYSEMAKYFDKVPRDTFRSEILAEFIDDAGVVFRNVRECASADHYTRRQGSWKYIISCDLAKFHDFTVFTVIDITNKQVVYIDRFTNLDYTTQGDRLVALYERFRPETIIIESAAAGEPFCEWMEARGLPVRRFITTNPSKKQIIEALALAFERGEIKIPNDETLIKELLSFEGKRLPSGKIRYAAPEGLHDDMCMSLAIGWSYLSDDHKVELITLETPWGRH